MSFNKALYCPPTDCFPDICPRPCIDVRNEPCISSCGDSTAVVYAPPVVVRFPGPTLATCPQDSIVGTALPNLPYRPGGVYGSGGGVSGSFSSGGSFGGGSVGGFGGVYGGNYGGGYGGGLGGSSVGGFGGVYGGNYGGGYGGGFGGGYGNSCGFGGSRSSRSISRCRGGSSGFSGGSCGPC